MYASRARHQRIRQSLKSARLDTERTQKYSYTRSETRQCVIVAPEALYILHTDSTNRTFVVCQRACKISQQTKRWRSSSYWTEPQNTKKKKNRQAIRLTNNQRCTKWLCSWHTRHLSRPSLVDSNRWSFCPKSWYVRNRILQQKKVLDKIIIRPKKVGADSWKKRFLHYCTEMLQVQPARRHPKERIAAAYKWERPKTFYRPRAKTKITNVSKLISTGASHDRFIPLPSLVGAA